VPAYLLTFLCMNTSETPDYDPATADRDRAEELKRLWPKFQSDLKVLKTNDWEKLAFRV